MSPPPSWGVPPSKARWGCRIHPHPPGKVWGAGLDNDHHRGSDSANEPPLNTPWQILGCPPSKEGWDGCGVPIPGEGRLWGAGFRPFPDEEGPVDLEDVLDVEALGAPPLGAPRAGGAVAHEHGVVLHIWGDTGVTRGRAPPHSPGDHPRPALPREAPPSCLQPEIPSHGCPPPAFTPKHPKTPKPLP